MASILETFYIMFRSDSSDVKKGAHEAKEASDKLKDSLKGSEEFSKKLGEKFSELAGLFSNAILSFLSVESLAEGLKATADYSEALFNLGKELNISTDEIDAWGNAVEKVSGSSRGFEATLRTLDRSLSQIALRGPNQLSAMLARVGIDARHVKDSISLLQSLAPVFERLGKRQSKEFGLEIGLDAGTILLLQRGKKAVDELIEKQRQLGITAQQSAEKANEFFSAWEDVSTAFRKVKENLNDQLLPILTKAAEIFKDFAIFLQSHSQLVTKAITAIAATMVFALVPAIVAVTTAALPWIGIVVAIGLIIEALEKLWDLVKDTDAIKNLGNIFMSIGHAATSSFDAFLTVIREIKALFSDVTQTVVEDWQKIAGVINKVTDAIGGARHRVRTFLGFKDQDLQAGQQALANTANLPIALQTQNSTANSKIEHKTTNVNTGPITIETQATDAEGIANSFSQTMKDHFRFAINQWNNGTLI